MFLSSSTLASMLPGGSVTYLFYADRIMELPLGVFAIAIGTAVLPSFSRHVAAGNMDELKSSISFSLRLMLFLDYSVNVRFDGVEPADHLCFVSTRRF
jgi:putative peptidoglycan lipid II flippase